MTSNRAVKRIAGFLAAGILVLFSYGPSAWAQFGSTNLQGYGFKIFRVESGAYPFVQAYIRTFNQDMQPLINLNELNVGVMVEGRPYDVAKRQYMIQSIANRKEAIRTVFVLDASASMAGAPFDEAIKAAARFIDMKRPQDQVGILAIVDNTNGYEIVSNFERDNKTLGDRLADVQATGRNTRLYDAIGAAMQMCGLSTEGGTSTGDASYVASCSIIVFSDGKDEGSALSRSDLMTRITNLQVPIPIYSLAYSRVNSVYLKNLQALSKNSFGVYYPIGRAITKMTQSVQDIQNILQNDYVVTFRSYLPVDGKNHDLKIGIEYPSRSGKMRYQSTQFEALEAPPLPKILAAQKAMDSALPRLSDGNPYLSNPYSPTASTTPGK